MLNQTLVNPIGAVYVYSDLSMITGQYVVGTVVEARGYVSPSALLPGCAAAPAGSGLRRSCFYEAFVRTSVFEPLGMMSTGFLPAQSQWASIVPTWNDTTYRHRVIQGQVSDENSYALGGIAGHAGVFSNVLDVAKLATAYFAASSGSSTSFLNATTVALFTKAYNLTQSSRALGWDTNDYTMNTYRGCSTLSPLTFMHTGFTGTEICIDPVLGVFTILFTNRVYPNQSGQSLEIQTARQAFNSVVAAVVQGHGAPSSSTGN